MDTTTENRPITKTRAEYQSDRGDGMTSYKSNINQRDEQATTIIWVYLIAFLVIAGGGYYYYASNYMSAAVTPGITETVAPPMIVAPEAATPPVVAPDTATPSVITPDPTEAPKTLP